MRAAWDSAGRDRFRQRYTRRMESSVEIDSIEKAALELRPDARARLAHSLVSSLGNLSSGDLHALWIAEAERRDAEIESGSVQGIPGDKVFDRIESRYGK